MRCEIKIWHDGLNKHRVIRDAHAYVAEQKAEMQVRAWDETWQEQLLIARRRKIIENGLQQAALTTAEAQKRLNEIREVLSSSLKDRVIDWNWLKESMTEPQPSPPSLPPEPKETLEAYQPVLGFWDYVVPGRRLNKIASSQEKFKSNHIKWEQEIAGLQDSFDRELAAWKERKRAIEQHCEQLRRGYYAGSPEAVTEYFEIVLENSLYPVCCPQEFETIYKPDSKILVIDYLLPAPEQLPVVKEVSYVQKRDEFVRKEFSKKEQQALYDSLLYQICLRTIHELYVADTAEVLAAVAFNGWVRSIDPGTGNEIKPCVLSVQASREEFLGLDLAKVDPKACFKTLKGVGSARLYRLTAIAPVLQIDKDDSRFIDSYDVTGHVDKATNLAAMDWEDFEHLIREIFEAEFAGRGGEVKVTQASRDRGVDAVAFDPDPISGGKIVIQAKRYTNTVGVAAVRDLYGTVMNEGANKGILVTTSDYGPDAYEFAKGKPLTLLSGSNLLHLLSKHGHKAKIDLEEAKKILAEKDSG